MRASCRRARIRARLHWPAWIDAPRLEPERVAEREDLALAGEMLEALEEKRRAREARRLARLLRRQASKQDNE